MSPYGDLVAAAQVSAVGAFVGRSFGFEAAPTVLASVYTFLLSNDIDINNASIKVTPIATAAARVLTFTAAIHVDDNTITVSTFSAAGAAADRPFSIEVRRRGVRAA